MVAPAEAESQQTTGGAAPPQRRGAVPLFFGPLEEILPRLSLPPPPSPLRG